MRRWYLLGALLCLSLWAGTPISAQAADDFKIERIRFGNGGGRTRIVVDSNRPAAFRAFFLDQPRRLMVDLPAATWGAVPLGAARVPLIARYRSGVLEDSGLTRIVFDLTSPAEIVSAFVIPRKAKEQNDRLVIDLKPVSAQAFQALTTRVWGDRQIRGHAVPPKSETAHQRSESLKKLSAVDKKKKPSPMRPPLRTVVIDAGHGGQDPGAMNFGVREKDITLAMAIELRRQLEETGRYRVVLTRDKDNYILLRGRVDLSRRAGADLFVSLHADKIPGKEGVRGASIYTLSQKASDKETALLAEGENNAGVVAGVDLKDKSEDVADILLDLAMREKMNESKIFAQVLEQSLRRKNIKLLQNTHRSAGFAVLKAPDVPAVLVEMGFLSNKEEVKLLNSGVFQRKMATALADGVEGYFYKMQALQRLP